MKKLIFKIVLFSVCLFLACAYLFYRYFINIDVGCYYPSADTGHACYSLDFVNLVPVASVNIKAYSLPEEDMKSMDLTLTPVGIAAKVAGGNKFVVTSSFGSVDFQPRSYDISLISDGRLRYTKTSIYDFENRVLRWEKSYPPDRDKKNLVRTFVLSDKAHSPLSVLNLVMVNHYGMAREDTITVQADKVPFRMRKTAESEVELTSYGARIGKVTRYSYALSTDSSAVEPWRRRKEMNLDLFFPNVAGKESNSKLFPYRAVLPFNLFTLNIVPEGKARGSAAGASE